ncbi:serine hydrolase domain-containing protein [Promethearchaeum syntrophicum]|uniref:Serine hydrolase domain-containing protein n=1 Tax=Promethearchaeum syntrophicum TaxID=2594042 RepID=A0A5B9DDT8_9ARCH|nr:serine hydrolase [Candidatus Prometheoarchaeum syntrophicum]QEE17047.1 beta-lactamase/D-alanine carboxypeptidase [Candidatus Prometheoarchaeum syntrophicum]
MMPKPRTTIRNYSRKKEKLIFFFILLTVFSSSLVFLNEKGTSEILPDGSVDNFRKNNIFPSQVSNEIPDISNLTQLEDFLDYYIPFLLTELDTMGGVISVVKDDTLLISKGYGYSDIEKVKPVEPNSTQFRVGSVSKLFTWTGIMQLVEQDILDLDTDINDYLKSFQVPETFSEPITLKYLLTHTAGFEETYSPIISDIDLYSTLEEELKTKLPPRIRPPGIMTSYSNFGTALAGFIIEETTGIKYEEFIEENILKVLGMNRSSFYQPLPLNLTEDSGVPTGFYYDNNQFYEGFYEYISIVPAGGMSTTANDMANFMIANLNNGTFKQNQILQNNTIQEMQSEQFTTHPQFPGMCYGFYELPHDYLRIIGHGGDMVFYHSLMSLIPEENLGIFISFNSLDSVPAPYAFLNNLLNRFFPPSEKDPIIPLDNHEFRVNLYTGIYELTRRPYSTIDKILHRTYSEDIYEITANSNGELNVFGIPFIEIEPFLLQDTSGYGLYLAFIVDEEGKITHFYMNDSPVVAFEKLADYDTNSFQLGFFIFISSIFGLSIIYWLSKGIFELIKERKERKEQKSRDITKETINQKNTSKSDVQISNVFKEKNKPKITSGLPYLLVFAEILINIIFGLLLFPNLTTRFIPGYDFETNINKILIMPIFFIVMVIGTIIYAVLGWFELTVDKSKRKWSHWDQIHYTIIAIAGIGWIWFLNYWNLIGLFSEGI